MRLDLVVGPNGAGKSTFVELTLARLLPARTAFVNADEIAHQRWPGREAAHAYDAARIAARARTALLDQARPFIAETVFSHASKLDLIDAAHARGYFVALHVLLIPEEQAVARVRYRVAAGGARRAGREDPQPLVAGVAVGRAGNPADGHRGRLRQLARLGSTRAGPLRRRGTRGRGNLASLGSDGPHLVAVSVAGALARIRRFRSGQ